MSSSAPGFKTNIEGPITLDVQQRQRVDATLQPGEVSQTVEVHDDAPLLQTDTSETGQIVAAKTIVGLPLNGRNSVQLAQLTVGVTVSEPGARDVTSFGFSASGARSLDNNFLFAAPGPQNFNNSTVFGTPTFGYVTGAQAPRLLQFAAKLYY